jgi:Mn2+/Fe2+ NRAMP family transporter
MDAGTGGRVYWISAAGLFIVTEVVLTWFLGNVTAMVDFATILAFLTAPVIGWLTLRAVTSPTMPAEHRPGRAMLGLSWLGLLLLGGTGIVWVLLA